MTEMNRKELAWAKKMQSAIKACPNKGWGFYTIGDAKLEIYDKGALKRLGFYDNGEDLVMAIANAEHESGETIHLLTLHFTTQVEGVCG